MKDGLRQGIYTLLGFVLVGGALLGLLWLFAKAIEEGATVLAATFAASATVAGAFIVRYWDRKKEGEAARREHLGPLYEHMGAVMAGFSMTDRKREKVLVDFMRKSIVYASPSTLKAFRDWRVDLPEEDSEVTAADMLRYEVFVKAMRKDVGTSNFALDEGDLLRVVLSDYDEVFGPEPVELSPPDGEPKVTKVTSHKSSSPAGAE